MPTMTPVADQIIPPNPNQGVQTLSGILGLQQQRQQLQTGQYAQQSAQAKAVQDQQSARETQGLAQLMADPVGNGLIDKDGNPTPNAQAIIMHVAPTTGAAHTQNLLSAAKTGVEYKQAFGSLNNEQQQEITGAIAGPAADPKAGLNDVAAAVDAKVESARGTPNYDSLSRIRDVTMQVLKKANDEAPGTDAWRSHALALSRANLSNPQITGSGGIAAPSNASVNNGPYQYFGTVAPALQGGNFTPSGYVKNDLGPTDQPGYKAAVASATARQSGIAGTDVDRAAQVSASANTAPGAIRLSQEIDDLSSQIHSGKIAQAISKAAQAAGMQESTYARQLLAKDLGQLKTIASSGASTDAKMGTILSGYPDETSDERTIHTAMDYIRGSFRQSLARGQNLESFREKHPDLTGFQHADNMLSQNSDPLMHEFKALSTPEQRTEFYKRNFRTPQEAAEFKARVNGVFHATGQ